MAQARDGTTTQISCRVPKEVAEALLRIAQENERSLSWVASKALQQYVKGQVPK